MAHSLVLSAAIITLCCGLISQRCNAHVLVLKGLGLLSCYCCNSLLAEPFQSNVNHLLSVSFVTSVSLVGIGKCYISLTLFDLLWFSELLSFGLILYGQKKRIQIVSSLVPTPGMIEDACSVII